MHSLRALRLTALDLIAYCSADERDGQFVNMAPGELEPLLSGIRDQALRHTLAFGVGIHHAGLAEHDRTIVERLFVEQKIMVLVCTSTLAWGVNFPAHLVVVKVCTGPSTRTPACATDTHVHVCMCVRICATPR